MLLIYKLKKFFETQCISPDVHCTLHVKMVCDERW